MAAESAFQGCANYKPLSVRGCAWESVLIGVISAISGRRLVPPGHGSLTTLMGVLRVFRLAASVCHAHAAEHVIGKEELSIRGHHHDLQLVGKPLGNDLIN